MSQVMVRQLLMSSGIRGVARLVLALMRDRRVPLATKLIIPAAVVYLVSPIDLIPDIIPGLGQIDDVVILAVALVAFLAWVPRQVLMEHLRGGRPDPDRDQDSQRRPDAKVIEGTYRIEDDDRASR